MEIQVSNIGRIIQGDVLDVNRKHLELKLKQYDPFLEIKCNTEKRNGRGMWEIWRKPEFKTAVFEGNVPEGKIFRLEYVYDKHINHVFDCEYLNYDVLGRLQAADMWQYKDWYAEKTAEGDAWLKKQQDKNKEELRLQLRDERKYMKVLHEAGLDGINPGNFFSGTIVK